MIEVTDGRAIGFADYGLSGGTAVLWCHGGPGSRLEPAWLREDAVAAGLRIIGIDRPGYGLSTPRPGRTIVDVIPDLLAVADYLEVGQFVTVGVSTGGAYALAAAAVVPQRVLGVIACCSMTDMSWQPARATMSHPHTHAVWNAPDRDAAIAAAVESHGVDGSKMVGGGMNAVLPPSDLEMFLEPVWMNEAMAAFPAMFAHGLQGYADDRIADGGGWVGFDVGAITCPVTVLHGGSDRMAAVINAHHTAEIVPGAELVVLDDLGHFSIERHIVPEIVRLLRGETISS
jgi:pimeloyl-ACP methyl ester carboxylesterase